MIRPSGFLQKAISEVSTKFFKEEFRFRVIICAQVEELHQIFHPSQLTADLGGTMFYSHHEWIQQRIVSRCDLMLMLKGRKKRVWNRRCDAMIDSSKSSKSSSCNSQFHTTDPLFFPDMQTLMLLYSIITSSAVAREILGTDDARCTSSGGFHEANTRN